MKRYNTNYQYLEEDTDHDCQYYDDILSDVDELCRNRLNKKQIDEEIL